MLIQETAKNSTGSKTQQLIKKHKNLVRMPLQTFSYKRRKTQRLSCTHAMPISAMNAL
jgi:hypothetical protein